MKKMLSALLFAVMLFSVAFSDFIITFALQETSIEKTQLGDSSTYYEFDADTKTLTISGVGNMPDFANDSSSQPWYGWRSDGSIESIVVEEGISRLGNYAFYNVGAENVTLPSSLTNIGSYALAGNTLLTSITLGSNLHTISNNAFYQCNRLQEIVIPKSVTSIGNSAFESCTRLTSVQFERLYMTVSIGKRAFLGCRSLNSISIPINATLATNCIGFNTTSTLNSNMTMGIFRDSPAVSYVSRYSVNYAYLDTIEIYEDEIMPRTFYSDSVASTMKFSFTPGYSCNYSFASSGNLDVDCKIKDSNGTIIAQNNDVSLTDLNFSVSAFLNAGEAYSFDVTSVNSTGSYSVSLSASHIFEQQIIAPTDYDEGYTLSSCIYCGYSYKSDFVPSLALKCFGCVYEMISPDGDLDLNKPIENAEILDFEGNVLAVTDSDGCFIAYTHSGIVVSAEYGVDRTIDITQPNTNLGNIGVVCCDYQKDGYINAKDFAVLKKHYGLYESDDMLSTLMDTDKNGLVEYDDWAFAFAFVQYGNIDETIYNRLG